MISFIDEKGKRHSALATIKRKKAVNGEKSLEGVIHTNDDVISKMDIGWKVIFEYERYVITYAQPIDNGNTVELQFDAVHEFFYDFLKSSVYETLNGSHTMEYYLNFIFKDSGYTYLLDNPVPAFEKENFGMENRLSLFNNIINQVGAEFVVNNTVVRITDKVGQDLSTVVRKGLNMQDITIEKNIKNFITYRKGYGKFLDEEDESLGRVEAEYESALSAIYGRLEGDPFVDERFSTQSSLLEKIKESVENSYNISVQLTMEDLTKAGYKYEQPQEGDYIMVINEDIGFKKKVRIVSYESEFDTRGELIDHQVVCNSVGLVKATGDSRFDDIWHEIDKIEKNINVTYIAANGKNMIYRGPNEPNHDQLIINDTWYKDVGNGEHEVYIWTGAYWEKIIIEDARFNNLDANSMTTGSLRGGKVSWDLDTGRLLMGNSVSDYSLYFDGNNLNLGGNTSISWDNITSQPSIPTSPGDIGAKPDGWLPTWSDVSNKPTIPNDQYITNITKDTITTSYVNALGVRAKSLLAGTINIGNNAFQVDVDGWLHAGRGGFSVPPNSDGIY
ncbi:MAG TPA: phage tail protein, partial [Tissierellaceae bacterium]|nr:phage tail protein [Tissierellaceae bacterium]